MSLAPAIDALIRNSAGTVLRRQRPARAGGDLHLPNRAYLLHRTLKGLPETSPHHLVGDEAGLICRPSRRARERCRGSVACLTFATDQAAGLRRLFVRRARADDGGSCRLPGRPAVAILAASLARGLAAAGKEVPSSTRIPAPRMLPRHLRPELALRLAAGGQPRRAGWLTGGPAARGHPFA